MPDRTCSIDGCTKRHLARGWCSVHYQRWKLHGDPMAGGTPKGAARTFLAMAITSDTDECLPWPYRVTASGHGVVSGGQGHEGYAHRMVLESVAGPPPAEGMHAAHAPVVCHNPACVNPRHLRWATPAENMADKLADGTMPRKLTVEQVREVRAAAGSHAEIAARIGVAPSTVTEIKNRKRWAWLD